MTDQRLEEGAARLQRVVAAQGLPAELVDALIALLDVYVDRVTAIVAGQQVHRPPTTTTAAPSDDFDDPTGYDNGRR